MLRTTTCLNGCWDFSPYADTLDTLPAEWDSVKIQVPSPFNVNSFSHGYPRTTAGESYYVQGGDFRLYPEYPAEWEKIHTGFYRRTLFVPEESRGKRLFLHFDAVAYRSVYYLNGVRVGEATEGFLPIEVEITDHVKYGEDNELIVGAQTVHELFYHDEDGRRRCDYPHGSFWGGHIGGIWQDAWLCERPAAYIRDIFATTDVYKKTMTVRYEHDGGDGLTIKFFLTKWGEEGATEREVLSAPCDGSELCWQYADGDVALWDVDAPNLYTLTGRLYRDGEAVDETSVRIGFRTFTTEGDQFILNGRRIRLKNDSWHYMGYSIQTPDYARAYYRMAKDANVNIIRLHAQPFPSFFYDVADEMGMLLVSESGVWASHCVFSYNEKFFENSKQHLRRLIRRDRNHPSVVMWSPENECLPAYKVCGSSAIRDVADLEEKLYDLTQEIPALDSSRLISCDGSGDLGGRMPVNSLHYPGYDCPTHRGKPITIGEMGSMYFSTPDNVCMEMGAAPLYSFENRLESVARDAFRNLTGQRKWAAQVCVFNLIWYGLQPIPFAERALTYDDYTAPGIKPSRITPYLRTLNAGAQADLPDYIPNPVWEWTKAAYTPVRFFAENAPTGVFGGEVARFPLSVFNDHRNAETLTLTAVLSTEDGDTVLPEHTYTLEACTYTEDVLEVAMPAMTGTATLRLSLRSETEELFEDTLTVSVYDRAALQAEWDAMGVVCLTGDDADTDAPALDFRKAAPYGSFMKSRSIRHLFRADGGEVHFTASHDGRYFEEYLNFNAAPLYFNGAGMPVILDLTTAGVPHFLCGVELPVLTDEAEALALQVSLGRELKARIAAMKQPTAAYFYGEAGSAVSAMLDEIRCDYEVIDDAKLHELLRTPQTALLIADGSRSTDWLEDVSAANFPNVLVLGLTAAPRMLFNEFEVTAQRGFHLQPKTADALTAGMYGNNLYGLGVGREEALADRLLQYKHASDSILLGVPNVDWRMWNNNAENLKTVSILRSELADRSRLAALVRHDYAGSRLYFSQLSLNTQSKKAKNLLVRMLSALGTGISLAQNDDLNELLYAGMYGVRINRMLCRRLKADEDVTALHPGLNRVENGETWRIVNAADRLDDCALAVFVYSPQDRTDLLLNPDTIDLHVEADKEVTLYLGGEQQGSGTDFTVTSITLAAGWNTLLLRCAGGQTLPKLSFHRTNLKKSDLKCGLYDVDLKLQNMQKATLHSDDRPDGVERAIAGREQHWRASADQHEGIDFGFDFPAPITCRALYFSGLPSDFDRDCFTPYCFRLLAGDSADDLHEVYRSRFEDKMSYVNGKVFLRLDDVTARCFRLELTHNALKPWIISNLNVLL
mgnify:CR=1 FL=1|jgi:hypothetical protein